MDRVPFLIVISLLLSGPALACLNETLLSASEARKVLKRAEQMLEDGKAAAALNEVEDVHVDDEALARRLARVEAVARLRSDQLSLAISSLERQLRAAPDDPYLKARLAEGLSKTRKDRERSRKRALQLLEELERGDLMPDAEAYLSLALLRQQGGDAAGADKALARCKERAKRPAICALPAPRS